jgi:hypothetical protein
MRQTPQIQMTRETKHECRQTQQVGAPQLLARIEPPPLAAQPFAIHQPGARQLHGDPTPAEPVDRLAVQLVGAVSLGDQRPRAGLDPQRPLGPAGPRMLGEAPQRGGRHLHLAGARGRFDQIGQ